MIKTQVQIPDHLYQAAKRMARSREMSLAEVFRRGLECLLATYPSTETITQRWSLPKPRDLGWRGLTADRLRELATETSTDVQMKRRSRRHAVH